MVADDEAVRGEAGDDDRTGVGATDLDAVGRLSSETLEDRRARLVVPPPDGPRRGAWMLAVVALLLLGAGVWLGVLPGSSAVGRYPVWELYDLADRIDAANRVAWAPCELPEDGHVRVDLVTGRVQAGPVVHIGLTDRERAMLAEPAYAPVGHGPAMPDDLVGPNC